jgi:ribonuclease-3
LVGDRTEQRILANAFEAVLGAVYLDGGIVAAKSVAARCMFSGESLDALYRPPDDGNHKAALQEWLQARHRDLPQYSVVRTEGAGNRPTFFVEARSGEFVGTGIGPRKRAAESEAAEKLLRLLAEAEMPEPGSSADATVRSAA